MADKTPAEKPAAVKKEGPKCVIVRPYSKIVFLYPTMLIALVAGIVLSVIDGGATGWPKTMSLIFVATLFFNLLTIAFEFNRFSTIAIVLAIFAAVLGLILLNQKFGVLATIGDFLSGLQPEANAQFFFMVFGIMLLVFVGVFIDSRFDYWEFRPNEILHKHGFLGDVKRYPAPGTQVTKEISDVLEYLMLLSGRLVIFPQGAERPIVLENVVRINAVEAKIMKLLSSLSVTVDSSRQPQQAP